MLAGEVQDLVQFCLGLPAVLARLWDSVFEKLRAGEIEDLTEAGHSLEALFEKHLAFLQGIQQWARKFEESGHGIKGASELEGAIAELQRMKEQALGHWPWFTQKDIDDARAAEARGECIELDDAFAAVANVEKEEWLRRVRERRKGEEQGAGTDR